MTQFKNEILIERPVEEVFTLMAASLLESLPQRNDHTTLSIEQLTEGAVGKGTQYRLISAKEEVEPDSSISEFLKGLDLDLLEPDLRKELKESFIEITAFEKNKLLELVIISETDKSLERFRFRKKKDGTKIEMSFRYEVTVKGHKIITFLANRMINYMLKKSGVPENQQEFKDLFENSLNKPVPPETTINTEN